VLRGSDTDAGIHPVKHPALTFGFIKAIKWKSECWVPQGFHRGGLKILLLSTDYLTERNMYIKAYDKLASDASYLLIISFHPETVLFPFGCVNLHNYSSPY